MSTSEVSSIVRKARQAAGISREQLAFRVGTSTSTITRLEREGRVPRTGTVAAICDELGIPVDAIVNTTVLAAEPTKSA